MEESRQPCVRLEFKMGVFSVVPESMPNQRCLSSEATPLLASGYKSVPNMKSLVAPRAAPPSASQCARQSLPPP
jgi:hypothetical protein